VAARFAAGAVRTARLVRAARPAKFAQPLADELGRALGIARAVRALESADVPVPMAWGSVTPTVLLPRAAREWPAARLHAVVLHELVHVRRHDLPAQMAAQAACCLYWFHPLVWLAARQLRKERETACDDAVLAIGVPAPDYAGHLLEMARTLVARRSLADAPAMAEAGDLEERVRAVLDRGRNRAPLNRRLAATVATLACALVLPVALVTLRAQAPNGALNGIVQDISSARVPGTKIQIKNLDGKNEEIGTVNAAGEFGFAAIPAGRYSIEARASGFAVGKTEILVESGRTASALITLPIGQINESVTVKGSRPATGSLAPAAPTRTPQRIPVGGNVQAARLIRQPRAIYPEDLKAQGITGTVIIKAVISTTGEPLNPQVVNTAVNFGLAQAALDAVRQWRYQPTLLNGQPIEVTTTIQVTFELEQ
jgi:TonB family protein